MVDALVWREDHVIFRLIAVRDSGLCACVFPRKRSLDEGLPQTGCSRQNTVIQRLAVGNPACRRFDHRRRLGDGKGRGCFARISGIRNSRYFYAGRARVRIVFKSNRIILACSQCCLSVSHCHIRRDCSTRIGLGFNSLNPAILQVLLPMRIEHYLAVQRNRSGNGVPAFLGVIPSLEGVAFPDGALCLADLLLGHGVHLGFSSISTRIRINILFFSVFRSVGVEFHNRHIKFFNRDLQRAVRTSQMLTVDNFCPCRNNRGVMFKAVVLAACRKAC